MKDYYYILGITAQATPAEIKTAYRKLSTKFHPDKNGGDLFFEERFKEIHEAYDTLSRPERRANYDRARSNQSAASGNSQSSSHNNFYPTIESFTASPTKIYDGDEVEFSWNVFNADSIQIEKIGNVPARGKKRIKISGLRSAKSISVTLSALNTNIGKSEKKSVQIFSQAYEDIEREISNESKKTSGDREGLRTETKEKSNEASFPTIIFWAVLMIIFLIVLASIVRSM